MSKIANNIFKFEFAEQTLPSFSAQKNKDWVLYGNKNDYTRYLIDLFNRNAEHNAIVTGKTNYIAGKSVTYDKTKVEDVEAKAKLDLFLSYANQFEDWYSIDKKITLDFELFNGFALQVIRSGSGKITDVYHLEFSKIRLSKDGKTAFYCDNWFQMKPETDPSFKSFPLFDENRKDSSAILYYKVSRPTSEPYGDTYPIPDYVGCTSDIETDINITTFHFSNSANGMTAQALLTFFNGDPTEEDKRALKKLFEKNHTSPDKAGSVIFNFVDENQKGVELTNLSASDLDKQFEILSKRLQQKIFTGHKVTNPVLFGIKTEGQLGNRNELIEAFEHFTKTYIDLRRIHILNTIKLFARLKGVIYEEIYIEPLEPIGLEIPLTDAEVMASLTFDEKRQLISKKYGIELTALEEDKDKRLTLATKLGVGGVASLLQVIQSQLPVKQKATILNTVFGVSLKKAYDITGFTPETAASVTAPQQMSETDPLLEALLACRIEDNDDEILEEKFVDFDSPEAAETFEKHQAHKFAEVVSGDIKTLRKKLLDLLAGSPETKPEVLAKQLGIDEELVNELLADLIDKKWLIESETGFNPTGKGADVAEELPIAKTEIYTVYKYVTRNDVPSAKESRDFCKKMLASGGTWERKEIDKLSNEFSTNVWIYRGGWYTNPDTKEKTPYCRHVWKSVTKVRRK